MMEQILEPFVELQSLSIERQCQIVVACSVPALIFAAFIREFVGNKDVQICARLCGAGAVFALVCFANYATGEALKAQQFVQKAKNVSENLAPAFVVAHQVKTKSGTVVEWTSDGRSDWALRTPGGRIGRSGDKDGIGGCVGARQGNGPDAVSDATDAADAIADQIAEAGRRF